MPSDVSDQKLGRTQNAMSTHLPPKIAESLPCPRCDSTSTKFCYYNNYNLSQPRHFCKACRRFWTHGGTLRNVPVGGGTRKNSKRTRSCSSSATSAANSSSSTVTHEPLPISTNLVSGLPSVNPEIASVSTTDVNLNLNENVPESGNFTGMFSNMQGQNLMSLGGFNGYSIGSSFEELGLGFCGTRVWEIPEAASAYAGVNGSGSSVGGVAMGAASSGCNTWQVLSDEEGGNGVVVGEDYFGWSGRAISTPGQGLK